MILCVSPNPAIDRNLVVPSFRPGAVLRAGETLVMAGGKGVNVARAVRTLGGEALIAGPLGGASGRIVAELAADEGLAAEWTWVEGETRTCVIVVPEDGGEVTVINEPGPVLSVDDWQRVHADVRALAPRPDAVCICGSMPLGCPPNAMGELVSALRAAGSQVWVDTSGDALRSAIDAKPYGLKINVNEAGEVLGLDDYGADVHFDVASELRGMGIDTVALTLGDRGAMLASGDGCWSAVPPSIGVASPVGSGDSFMAGLLTALGAGQAMPDALKQAVAVGAANAASVGSGRFRMDDVRRLLTSTWVGAA